MEHVYTIEEMHCQSCVDRIGEAIGSIPGVVSSRVTWQPPRATVAMDRHVPLVELQNAVRLQGEYTLQPADEGAATKARLEQGATVTGKESLYPLGLIVGYLLGMVLLFAGVHGDFSLSFLMTRFMGGFFVAFSFFKFLDLRGFAEAYRSYDIIAGAVPSWGFAYPFLEAGLGVAYLAGLYPVATRLVTLFVMAVGSIGVLRAVRLKSDIRCACLGTVLNLPLTKVTLVEDVGMAVMAAVALAIPH